MRTHLSNLALGAVLAAMLLAGCGRAAVSTIAPDTGFAALDADGDGKLSREESGMLPVKFADMDRNGDGYLSQLEWQGAGRPAGVPDRLQQDQETRPDQRPVGPGTW